MKWTIIKTKTLNELEATITGISIDFEKRGERIQDLQRDLDEALRCNENQIKYIESLIDKNCVMENVCNSIETELWDTRKKAKNDIKALKQRILYIMRWAGIKQDAKGHYYFKEQKNGNNGG